LDECRRIREFAQDCRLVLLCATSLEARPIIDAMASPRRFTVATKRYTVGELYAGEDDPATRPSGASARAPERVPLRVVVAITGCDKANAAHVVTCLLQAMDTPPAFVLQVGIAGALPVARGGDGAGVGDLVLATKEVYADTGSSSPRGWLSAEELKLPIAEVDGRESGNTFELDEGLIEAASAILGDSRVVKGPCVTVSRVSGLISEGRELVERWGAVAETMEGAAAAHICALYGVPFLEVRGISNMVVDRDRASWRVEEAVAIAGDAAITLCGGFDELLLALERGAGS
jgi:futalosine hydrolase